MAKLKNTFSLNISGGEEILVNMADDLCKKAADAIAERARSIDSRLSGPRGEATAEYAGIQRTYGRKAKAPYGHRRVYRVRAQAFGVNTMDIGKTLSKAKDAGRF